MPDLDRMMIFIDGENLVFRYQNMLKQGYKPFPHNVHVPEVLVWSENLPPYQGPYKTLRATYYTYAVGDDTKIMAIREKIRGLRFTPNGRSQLPNQLTPQVFKKRRQGAQAKGVDIQLTVDVLTHVHNNNIDAVYLFSGDGDYEPLVREVHANGKQVYLAAFSNGLNQNLTYLADLYVSLDGYFFNLSQ